MDLTSFCLSLVWVCSPNSVVNTWGSYGSGKRPGFRSEVADGIPGNFRPFVLACSFFLVILVLSAWLRWAWAGFACEFS